MTNGDLSVSEPMFPQSQLTPHIPETFPKDFTIRALSRDDINNVKASGYLDLLSQLTSVGAPDSDVLNARYSSMADTKPLSYYVVVIVNSANKIVGSATLVLEWKFIHEAGSRGRVEDVVVDKDHRQHGFGGLLIKTLVSLARSLGVYKLSLECKDELIPFYGKFGFVKDVNFLVQRFD
uniref:Glucosamine 6-phosphate N-acetyltransferase n=1 Tax=Panagrellus redivivus TaxID=6233 RepID=A0A7E4VVG7_PANRE